MATQILLNPIGSGGDVFPYLALGRELHRRGHKVVVLTNRLFRKNVEQAGLDFVEVGTTREISAIAKDPRLHDTKSAWKLALRWGAVGTMRRSYEAIQHRINSTPETMLVAPVIGMGARIAAEKFRVPLATTVLSPFVIRSAIQSPVIKPMVLSDWMPPLFKRMQFWVADRFFIDPVLATDISGFRREVGLPPCSRFLHHWCFSDDLVLALFPEVFAPPQPDWPSSTRLTGTVSWDPPFPRRVRESLNRFIDPDRKPITLLAGSAGPGSSQFVENWFEATKQMNRQLIFLERNPNMVPSELPGHVFHAEFFPMDDAAARSALVAHSGGVGTTLRTLAAGVPQLVFPRVNDQPDNANRVRRLGVGKIVRFDRMGVRQIVSAATSILDDEGISEKCAAIKKEIPETNAVEASCDQIEAVFVSNQHRRIA